ncbi:MAG: hypothetical protein RML84_11360 [Anaerolineae bacterium]|nr:hypothetical protein [Anaerolineae bacterium]
MYRDDSISIAHAVRAIITDLRTRCGVWIDTARVAPEVAADPAALDGAYLALARAGEALDEAIEALERARGNPQPAQEPTPAPGQMIDELARAILRAYDLPRTSERRKALDALEEYAHVVGADIRAAFVRANDLLEQERGGNAMDHDDLPDDAPGGDDPETGPRAE